MPLEAVSVWAKRREAPLLVLSPAEEVVQPGQAPLIVYMVAVLNLLDHYVLLDLHLSYVLYSSSA